LTKILGLKKKRMILIKKLFVFLVYSGIVNSEGNLWKENRSFLLRNNMGMKFWDGTRMNNIAKTVRSQVRQLVTTIDGDFNGAPVDPTALFNCAISNVICSMVMSKSFLYTDPQFQRFMSNFDEGFKLFTETGAVMFIPWLKYLSGISDSCKKLHANREEMLQFVRQVNNQQSLTILLSKWCQLLPFDRKNSNCGKTVAI
jgi:hypothetical protein